MFIQRLRHSKLLRIAAIVSLLLGTLLPFTGSGVQAGREGVFINDQVYFALDSVSLSPGADNQTLRFGVELVNGSNDTIDFNQYGVRVVDSDGNAYSVDLTERSVARVAGGSSSIYRYMAQIPSGISSSDLKVDIFSWDFSRSDYMQDLGALSVSAAEQLSGPKRQTVVLNMDDVDSTYPNDALVAFELIRSYKVLTGGTWYLYSDLVAENLSETSLKLPSGLVFQLKDSDGLIYSAVPVYGGDQAILPHQLNQITMQSPIGSAVTGSSFVLEFDKKASGTSAAASSGNGSSGAAGGGAAGGAAAASANSSDVTYTALGKLDLSRSVQLDAVGESASQASKDASSLTFTVDKVTSTMRTDGVHVDATFTAANKASGALPVPTFNASLQLTQSTLSVAAPDTGAGSSHPAFLSPGDSATYHFAGVLPKGVDPSSVQLVVFDKKPTTPPVSIPVKITALPPGVDDSGASTPGSVTTSVGNLSLTLKTTYRLLTETGDDVLMSEIAVQNTDSQTITLPAAASFYGGHMLGGFDAQGKAIRLQSSPYLSPGQKTTVYVYSKIPYDTVTGSGYVYIGDGTFNQASQSWTQQNEWIELPFASVAGAPAQTALNTDWFISDAGRMATGKIVESKVYDNGTNVKTVAIRVVQTNKETRNGANVPYIGYVKDSNGSVWALKATEDAGKLCKECQAMTTLWANVPASSVANGGLQVVFGQKIDDNAFATAQQYSFDVSPEPGSIGASQISEASLYPYTVSMLNPKLRTNGGNIEVSFDYTQSKSADMTGISKDRNLEFSILDANNNAAKTWDYPLDGTLTINNLPVGPLTSGSNVKLTLPISSISNDTFSQILFSPRLAVYEKFEGGTRLIGTLSLSLN